MSETPRIDPFALNFNSVDINFMEIDDFNMVVSHPTEIVPWLLWEDVPRHVVWEYVWYYSPRMDVCDRWRFVVFATS